MLPFAIINLVLLTSCIQSTLGDLLWTRIQEPYPNNLRQKPLKETTKENRVYPVVVFPDQDPLEIELGCIKDGYEGNNDPTWRFGDLEQVGEVSKEKADDYAKWTTKIRISSRNAGIQV